MYHIIINPSSCTGKGIHTWHRMKDELDRQSVPYKSYLTTHFGHGRQLAEQICQAGSEEIIRLIIVGGDGTVNEVVNGIPDLKKVNIGFVPAGSSNDLGRSLGLSKDPIINLNNILKSSTVRLMDIGVITGSDKKETRFLISSGAGYDASVCQEALNSSLKTFLNHLRLGKLTYILLAIKQIFAKPFMNGAISADGGVFTEFHKILLITTMIQKYEGGGMKMAPEADPNDGLLSICMVHGLSKLLILFLLPNLLFGRHTRFKGVETFNCRELSVRLSRSEVIHVDGECPGEVNEYKIICQHNELQLLQ